MCHGITNHTEVNMANFDLCSVNSYHDTKADCLITLDIPGQSLCDLGIVW